jgi:predicted metal-dependent enzyme (double-stranded beta helix superfamily)
MLRGEEISTPYRASAGGGLSVSGAPTRLVPGQVEALSPKEGDIHQVKNAFDDRVSISIHVYGGNIGAIRRHVFQIDGTTKDFISGYSNVAVPNLWDQSRAA